MAEQVDLERAVGILYEMEINNYLMTRAIQNLDYKISRLGYKNHFYVPVRKEASMDLDNVGGWSGFGMLLGAIIGGVSGCSTNGILSGIGGLLGGGVAGVIIGLLVGLIAAVGSQDQRDTEYQEQFDKEMKQYDCQVEKDNARVKYELELKDFLVFERDRLIKRRAQAMKRLSEFYMRVGIDQRFRSLIPMGKMHEIMTLNITKTLSGDRGLYDRVRTELREDAFYAKLEEISSKLDTLIDRSDKLYAELMDINYKCDSMIRAAENSARLAVEKNILLGEAVKNTRIAAYNSERIAAEERYQSMLMTFDRR